jgi:HAD superfamily hydrolase (TIGR01662 family)
VALTPEAEARLKALADRRIAQQKDLYRGRVQRLKDVLTPPLSNAELSVGLGLMAQGVSDIGRYMSTAKRNRNARPDTRTRVLIDLLLDGELFLAVQAPRVPGARREVLVAEGVDVPNLGWDWTVKNLAGRPIPDRSRPGEDWDDEDAWDIFDEQPRRPRPAGGLPRRLIGRAVFPIGLGCMRVVDPAVLHAARDEGVTLFDTADVYTPDEDELGHNERLLAEFARDEDLVVATKCGLGRGGGRWYPNGRPEHLRAAAEASLVNLGVEALDLLQWHRPDSRVPFADSFGELLKLQDEGKVRHLGLCNVSGDEVRQALAMGPVASVQIAAHIASVDAEVLALCAAEGIAVLAHSPLGGHRRPLQDAALMARAELLGVPWQELALAWLLALGPHVIPIPGASRIESVRSSVRAPGLTLDPADLKAIDRPWAPDTRKRIDAAIPPPEPEIVLIAGRPGAGKSSRVQPLLDAGYTRFNRDEFGGSLKDLLPRMERAHGDGDRHFVLDNTYGSRTSRAEVVALAQRLDLPVRVVYVDTPLSESLVNACGRMLDRFDRLLTPEELRRPPEPNLFGPQVPYTFDRGFEPPTANEGFKLERAPFRRRRTGRRRALLLDADGTLRRSTGAAPFPLSPDEVELLPNVQATLRRYHDEGWLLAMVSNQSGVARGTLSLEAARAGLERTAQLLDLPFVIRFCPHAAGAITCWCRKPMPGMGVELLRAMDLDRDACIVVGDQGSDEDFAANLGSPFVEASEFFAGNATAGA